MASWILMMKEVSQYVIRFDYKGAGISGESRKPSIHNLVRNHDHA